MQSVNAKRMLSGLKTLLKHFMVLYRLKNIQGAILLLWIEKFQWYSKITCGLPKFNRQCPSLNALSVAGLLSVLPCLVSSVPPESYC